MLRAIAHVLGLAQALLIPVITAAGHAPGFVPDHVLRVSLANITVACETRLSVVVNGTSPGPTIHLPPGRTTWIRVYNDMPDTNFTMHWHGLAQRMAPFSDGSLASQWPMKGGSFFDYQIMPTLDDPGTYFFHAHTGLSALTAFGALIVDDCGAPPFDYDEERILVFSDFFHATDEELVSGLEHVPFKWTGETKGVLLNGLGIAINHTAVLGPPAGQATDVTTTNCTLPVIDVEAGKTYRFRLIGGTGLSLLTMALEDHGDLTIIAVDGGEYNQPVTTDHIKLASGQRFDLLFHAKSAQEIQAANKAMYYLQFETRDRPSTYIGYGVLRYQAQLAVPIGPAQPILQMPTEMGGWMEYTFQPLVPEANRAPTTAEVTRRLIIDSVQTLDNKTGRIVWQMAHLAWDESLYTDRVPALVDIYLRGDAAVPDYNVALGNYGWDPATLTFPVRVGEVLEIVFQNTGSHVNLGVDSHPIHAHGPHIFDQGMGLGAYDAAANNAKMDAMNYRPVRRDTTMLYRDKTKAERAGQPMGWRAWRMRFDSPGAWMVHCHTLAHMKMGMQLVLVVGNASEIRSIPFDDAAGYLTFGGNVLGNVTHDPQVVQYFDDTARHCHA